MDNLDNSSGGNNNKVSIRFILDRNHIFTHLFDKSTTFKQVEDYLFTNKPKELFSLDCNNDSLNKSGSGGSEESENSDKLLKVHDKVKFLYSGKLFSEKETVKDLEKTQKQHPLNCQLVKVKNPNLKQESTSQKNQSQQQQSATESVNLEVHFHGCFFDYDEFKQIEEIFNRKQDSNEKVIKLSFLNQFLHKYWSYLIQNQPGLVDNNNSSGNSRAFPTERLSLILRNVLKVSNINSETPITKEQFRIIFYLFTSNSEYSRPCPNGSYNIVKTMIKQYHPTIDEGSTLEFNQEEFDKIYNLVLSTQPSSVSNSSNGSNGNQHLTLDQQRQFPTLSCISIELLFYLYTASIVIMKEEQKRLNTQQNEQNSTTTSSV